MPPRHATRTPTFRQPGYHHARHATKKTFIVGVLMMMEFLLMIAILNEILIQQGLIVSSLSLLLYSSRCAARASRAVESATTAPLPV